MPDPFQWIDDALAALRDRDHLRDRSARTGPQGPKIIMDGQRYLHFGSNDYLGVAADPRLREIVNRSFEHQGWGSGASPLIVGRSTVQGELERRLAEWVGNPAALLFPTGFATGSGTIPCLVGPGDTIFSDAKNHASLIDGCRLSRANVEIYPHANPEALRSALASTQAGRKLIVTDTLFSMDGDEAPLEELAELARESGAMLLVDEAHALGVLGPDGRGLSHHLGPSVIRIGTLSKALGSHGGFVAGPEKLITWLWNRARSYVFSTASPAANAAVALAALRLIRDEPERREQLLASAQRVRESLTLQGWAIGSTTSHIVPVRVGSATAALQLSARLRQHKLWVPCIRPPSVPDGESLLRISLSSAHTSGMIDVLLDVFHLLSRDFLHPVSAQDNPQA